MLQERQFDEEAVGDMVHLRDVLELTDEQVAEALAERARRIRAKMGPIMFRTSGMTAEGIARKATEVRCCAALGVPLHCLNLGLARTHALVMTIRASVCARRGSSSPSCCTSRSTR